MTEDYVPFEGLPHLKRVVKDYNKQNPPTKMGIKLVPNKGVTAYLKKSP